MTFPCFFGRIPFSDPPLGDGERFLGKTIIGLFRGPYMIRRAEGFEQVTKQLVKFCLCLEQENQQHGLDPLLRFSFSGPVNYPRFAFGVFYYEESSHEGNLYHAMN